MAQDTVAPNHYRLFKRLQEFYAPFRLCPAYPGTKWPIYVSPNSIVEAKVEDPEGIHWRYRDISELYTNELSNKRVLWLHLNRRYNVGVLTGRQRDGRFLVIQDFDVDDRLGLTRDQALDLRLSWISKKETPTTIKRNVIPNGKLLKWNTLITLSPSGGFHAWFYTDNVTKVNAFIAKMSTEQEVDWVRLRGEIRAENGFTVEPPSTFRGNAYFFLDNGKTPVLDVSNEPIPRSVFADRLLEEFKSMFGSRGVGRV